MTTIYEVIETFMQFTMPNTVYQEYDVIMQSINVVLTMIVVFNFILIPLYRMGTFWKSRK
jgi:VanZ family protein